MPIRFVQIQTIDLCNASCVNCPYRLIRHTGQKMRNYTFIKLIQNLAEVADNHIQIFLHLENEPLLDGDLFNRVKFIRDNIPHAVVSIITNGILLPQKYEDIIENIDTCHISLDGYDAKTYNQVHNTELTEKHFDEIAEITNYLIEEYPDVFIANRYFEDRVGDEDWLSYYFRSKNLNYSRLGAISDIPKVDHNKIKGCTKEIPYNWINVLHDGNVIVCCMDYFKEIVLGNINHQTIEEILNSKLYNTVMKKINGEIESEDDFMCKRCERAINND